MDDHEFRETYGMYPEEAGAFEALSRLISDDDVELGATPWFWMTLGLFHFSWATVDSVVDYALGLFLHLPHPDAHLVASGMMFGRKARLLADLIGRSAHPKRKELLEGVNRLRGEAKRDIIAHGQIESDRETVTFIERQAGGKYTTRRHSFTKVEFITHVRMVFDAVNDLAAALELDRTTLRQFMLAATTDQSSP